MTGRLLLAAVVVLGPPVLYGLFLLIRSRTQQRRQRRNNPRSSVYDIQARIQREREAADRTDGLPDDETLPPGWNWPQRDYDEFIHQSIPPQRMRPYIRQRVAMPLHTPTRPTDFEW